MWGGGDDVAALVADGSHDAFDDETFVLNGAQRVGGWDELLALLARGEFDCAFGDERFHCHIGGSLMISQVKNKLYDL